MTNAGYIVDPIDEMEDVVANFYGGRGSVGSQYVVTNRRLLIGPLNTKVALDIDTYVANRAAAGVGDVIKSVLTDYAPMNPKTLWLRHVVSVRPTTNAGWRHQASLEITTDTNETINLSVVAVRPGQGGPLNMGSGRWDPANNIERDKMVNVLTKAVESAKAAPPAR
jgi:hypothetical protein